MKMIKQWPVWVVGLFAATSLPGETQQDDQMVELEAFIVEETSQTQQETLQPQSVRLDTAFGDGLSLLEIPRGVSVLSESARDILGIDDYDSLSRFGAGTQRLNYFGLSGSAFLRGARAGTYFNGMLRAYQRNEMPMSFGSLDALEIVKGPAPAGYSPTLVGWYVNQRPKSPYFDQARGSLEFEVGSNDHYRWQLDYGAPFLLGDLPAAYRISYTGNRSDRYYDDVKHDFDSIYGAMKIRLSDRSRLTFGGEVYQFQSREVPGINRPTQALIDNNQYVIGEPVNLTSPDWGGAVARPLLEFPTSLVINPQLFALSIPGETARANIAPNLLSKMINLNDPSALDSLYRTLPADQVPQDFAWAIDGAQAALDSVIKKTEDRYLYTNEYFAAGGEALTTTINRRTVLADPRDYADSENVILFADLETRLDGDRSFIIRTFFEWLNSDKASSYGFAMQTKQLLGQIKGEYALWNESLGLELRSGLDFRYSFAQMLQDFDAEPFSRRDITLDEISQNTIVPAGSQLGPDGLNYWSSFGGASQESNLWQMGFYLTGKKEFSSSFDLHFGIRGEQVWYDSKLPDEVDRVFETLTTTRDDLILWTANLNPVYKVTENIAFYGAIQAGRALSPADGGTISGPDSFTTVELEEAGVKLDLLDGKLFAQLSVYRWEQSTYSTRDAAAEPMRGKGFEFEMTYAVTDWLTVLGAFTAQRVNLEKEFLGFGAIPQDEAGWALNGGILNATAPRGTGNNPELIYAGMPEITSNLYLVFQPTQALQIGVGPYWRDGYWHDMQRSMRIPGVVLWNAHIAWETPRWWIRLRVENLSDESYWIGQEPVFSAGTLILQGEGRSFELAAGIRF